MEYKIYHSVLCILLVGGLSVASFLGLSGTSLVFAAAESPPTSTSAENTPEQGPNDILKPAELEKIWRIIAVFLILSAVIESALTPVFNWRVFIEHAHHKGIRTPITMIFAFLIVWGYGLDIVRDLLTALGESVQPRIGGQVLTAFLLGGGSSGVNKLLQTWKIRLNDDERNLRASEAKKKN